jgi:hypothetical protein
MTDSPNSPPSTETTRSGVNTPSTPQSRTMVDADDVVQSDIIQRLERLEVREKESTKSVLDRLANWGALIALVISIATGAYTLFQESVVKPREKKQQQFETIVASIETQMQTATSKMLSQKDPIQKLAISAAVTANVMVLLQQAEVIEPAVQAGVSASTFMVLGNAELNVDNLESAQKYLRLAAARATDPSMHAEALRLLGRALSMSNTPEGLASARRTYAQAWAIERQFHNFNAPSQRAELLGDEIITEAYFGDCGLLASLIKRFTAEVSGPGILPEAARALRAKLATNLGNQTRCGWDRSAVLPPR